MIENRTVKQIAERIPLDYANHPGFFNTWLRRLSFILPIATLLILGAPLITGDRTMVAPGPTSAAHAIFEKDCARCHVQRRDVMDHTCRSCHDGPLHHSSLPVQPPCASCHTEHLGRSRLMDVPDGHCVRCHRDLGREQPETRYQKVILHLGNGHPEFALHRSHSKDPGRLRFNHRAHLAPEPEEKSRKVRADMKQAGKGDRMLTCTDCHVPDASGKHMLPVTYPERCAGCHTHRLTYDPETFGEDAVPHDRPEVVERYLLARYTERAVGARSGPATGAAKEDADEDDEDRRRPDADAPGEGTLEWASLRARRAAEVLMDQSPERCRKCHEIRRTGQDPSGSPRTVEPTGIPSVWLKNAAFRHRAHRMLGCKACHGMAVRSEAARDILLPSIESCKTCHTARAGASSSCRTCHVYHRRSLERSPDGPQTIQSLLGAADGLPGRRGNRP